MCVHVCNQALVMFKNTMCIQVQPLFCYKITLCVMRLNVPVKMGLGVNMRKISFDLSFFFFFCIPSNISGVHIFL